MKILLIRDYRSKFWLTARNYSETFDLSLLEQYLAEYGHSVEVTNYHKIDFNNKDYSKYAVFYQSAEDKNLYYKSFIEDIILGLKLQGALLIPEYIYMRAHHNKVFMEILRHTSGSEIINSIESWIYGTLEEYDLYYNNLKYPLVFKLSEGAQSKNIRFVKNAPECRKIIKKMTLSFNLSIWIKENLKLFQRKKYPHYVKRSQHRRKYILQKFIPNLSGDYKILVFDNKLFVLTRRVRENDFRASGSGKFSYEKNISDNILNYSIKIFRQFDVPFISLDIALYDNVPVLLEFQFVHFGTYTAELAPFYFILLNNHWEIVEGKIVIEELFAATINKFISTKTKNTITS